MNYEEIEGLMLEIEIAQARVADASLSRRPDRAEQIAHRKEDLQDLQRALAAFSVDTGNATNSERKLWRQICSGEVTPARATDGKRLITGANGNAYIVERDRLLQWAYGSFLLSQGNYRVVRMPSYFPKWEG